MGTELIPLEIKGHGLLARILPYGAALVDLRIDGYDAPLVLGMAPENYVSHPQFYMGAVVGRHANRIGFGQASVNGQSLNLKLNAPPHHSAGGEEGFSRCAWSVERHDQTELRLRLTSSDGHEGYPGELQVTASYALLPNGRLSLTYEAISTADTILNMCHHPYFNLDDSETVEDHILEIPANTYLPCDDTILPVSGPTDVTGGPFDFTSPRALGSKPGQTYNNTYCLSDKPSNPLGFAARLTGTTGVSMEIWTTQAGLHLYNGYKLIDCPAGISERRYGPRSGVCLEAQNWPDSPNHSDFPSSVLHKGLRYRQTTEYRFSRS